MSSEATDLAPEIEIVSPVPIAIDTQRSQPIRLAAGTPPTGLAPADDVEQVTAPLPIQPPALYAVPPLPPPVLYVVPPLPPATSAALAIEHRPGPIGAIVGFALVALAFAVGAYIVVV